MSDVTTADKTLGEQMWDLLERNPENYDVTFSVGLEKKEVKAVKFLLKAASRVLQKEVEEKWEKAVLKDGEGIPLPDVDPTAFELAVQLVIQDIWSLEVLKSLNLTPNTLLTLLGICRRFEITKAIKNLEEMAGEFLSSVEESENTDELLELTQSSLAALFACDNIVVDEKTIFDYACRWAEFQCSQNELEVTGENMRAALGESLFEIRFPIMSSSDFSKVGRYKTNLLKADEKLAVFEFVALEKKERSNHDKAQLPFKTHLRKLTQLNPLPLLNYTGSTLCLTRNLQILQNPPFVCDGLEKNNHIQISKGRIALYGIGFFGPINADAHYDVTIEIKNQGSDGIISMNGKLEKTIFARKQETFYFMFDTPVVLDPINYESTWNWSKYYTITFTLKGPDTIAYERMDAFEGPRLINGIYFRFYWYSGRNQFAEYLYKRL